MDASTSGARALGTRPLGWLVWKSCSQATLSVAVYGIYAVSNAWFVVRGVGTDALAAVSLVSPVLLILGAIGATVGAGGASLVSRCLGANDGAGASRAAGNALAVFWASALAVSLVGLLAIEPLLTALGARPESRDLARTYAVVILAGSVTATGFSSLVRAEGRMRFSTMLWVVPVIVHIALDPLLIFELKLGVLGAALGTVGGQAVSAAMGIWFFFVQPNRPYRIGVADLRPRRSTVAAILAIGAPSLLAGLGGTLSALLVNSMLAAAGGTVAVAAYAICARFQTLLTVPQVGITMGLQPIVGYSVGAGLLPRARQALAICLRAMMAYGVFIVGGTTLFAVHLAAAFTDNRTVTETAETALRIMSVSFAMGGITTLISAYFQALGRVGPAYAILIGSYVVFKIPLIFIIGQAGPMGVWFGLSAGELASLLFAFFLLSRVGHYSPTLHRRPIFGAARR